MNASFGQRRLMTWRNEIVPGSVGRMGRWRAAGRSNTGSGVAELESSMKAGMCLPWLAMGKVVRRFREAAEANVGSAFVWMSLSVVAMGLGILRGSSARAQALCLECACAVRST